MVLVRIYPRTTLHLFLFFFQGTNWAKKILFVLKNNISTKLVLVYHLHRTSKNHRVASLPNNELYNCCMRQRINKSVQWQELEGLRVMRIIMGIWILIIIQIEIQVHSITIAKTGNKCNQYSKNDCHYYPNEVLKSTRPIFNPKEWNQVGNYKKPN